MSELFDMVLKQSGLRFSELLDDEGKDEIRSFWDDIVLDRGTVTDAEIDSVLGTYKGLGVIVPADGTTNDQEKQLMALAKAWKETNAASHSEKSPLARLINAGYDRPTIEDSKGIEQSTADFVHALHAPEAYASAAGTAQTNQAAPSALNPTADPKPSSAAQTIDLARAGKEAFAAADNGMPHTSASDQRTAVAAAQAGYIAPDAQIPEKPQPDISRIGYTGRVTEAATRTLEETNSRSALEEARRAGLKQAAAQAAHEVEDSAVKEAKKLADKITEAVSKDAAAASIPKGARRQGPGCRIIYQSNHEASLCHPLMILADPEHIMLHHQVGAFTDPTRRTAFEFVYEGKAASAKMLEIDRRFINLLKWLGEGHIAVKLSGYPLDEEDASEARDTKGNALMAGYAVYKIRAVDVNANEILQTANNDFLQLVIRRMLASLPKEDDPSDASQEDRDTSDATMLLTDMPAMIDYVNCAEDSLPDNIRNWCHRQIAMVQSNSVSQEEQRHARHALSLMLNIQWQGNYFPSIDPAEARRILDEELYGMQEVKQRIIETIIQINRTHTLPSYGLLLVGPAGTGKSQIAYAVARILKLPWCNLDMSAIHDTEALTGSPRVYSNAKPGKIMEAFSQAGSSNLVFIINELDKAGVYTQNGNPADALLTLLDNLGYTDNYMECTIPTGGVYPIATANERSQISEPLLTRFAEIEISDYSTDEKKIIFRDYSLPKILKRMGMSSAELAFTDDAIDAVVARYEGLPGVRDLEQAAEHLAAHALFELETTKKGQPQIRYDAQDVNRILSGA